MIGGLLLGLSAASPAWELPNPLELFSRDKGDIVWGDGNQYVRVTSQDRFDNFKRPPKNNHPANLRATDIAAVLATMRYSTRAGQMTPDQYQPLFAPDQAETLSTPLANGLARADDDEDVTFLIGGPGGYTAGRAFVSQGKLNIIFGSVQKSSPGEAGIRRTTLDSFSGAVGGPGSVYYVDGSTERTDWAVIDIPTAVAAYGYLRKTPPARAAPAAEPAAAGSASELAQENRRLREEMARLRMEMQNEERSEAVAAPARRARSDQVAAETTVIEQRLATLKSLHDKELITNDEFEAKRKEILKDL